MKPAGPTNTSTQRESVYNELVYSSVYNYATHKWEPIAPRPQSALTPGVYRGK